MNNNKIFFPNFIILPKNVYLNDKLSSNDIKLYGFINAVCNNKNNYCRLGNRELAKLLNVETRSIQRMLANLKKYNLIIVEYYPKHNSRIIRTFIDKSLQDNLQENYKDLINYDWLNDQDE